MQLLAVLVRHNDPEVGKWSENFVKIRKKKFN